MWKILLSKDLRKLPKATFFLILLIFPLYCYTVFSLTGMDPIFIFGFICFGFLLYQVFSKYSIGQNIVVPNYLILFGIFTIFHIFSRIYNSDPYFEQEGPFKFFYSNLYVLSFIALLIVENTYFSPKWIKIAIVILTTTIFIAAIVSVVQVFDPLFFIKKQKLVQGLSFDRLAEYYSSHGKERTSGISRFLTGYRNSIYSYVTGISVGIDSIAVFSLLIALKSAKWLKTLMLVIAVALVSFLSSSRWIMLNFLVVASQNIWLTKNKFLNLLKYGLYFVILLFGLVLSLEFLGINIQQFIEERLMSDSANTRILAFEVFAKVYPNNPIIGTGGVDTAEMELLLAGQSSQIHVGYLKLFYYYGLIGGLLYLTFLYSLLSRLWKKAKTSDYWGGFFAVLAFAIANLTLVELNLFYYGLLLALIFANHFDFETTKGSSSYAEIGNGSMISSKKKWGKTIVSTQNNV